MTHNVRGTVKKERFNRKLHPDLYSDRLLWRGSAEEKASACERIKNAQKPFYGLYGLYYCGGCASIVYSLRQHAKEHHGLVLSTRGDVIDDEDEEAFKTFSAVNDVVQEQLVDNAVLFVEDEVEKLFGGGVQRQTLMSVLSEAQINAIEKNHLRSLQSAGHIVVRKSNKLADLRFCRYNLLHPLGMANEPAVLPPKKKIFPNPYDGKFLDLPPPYNNRPWSDDGDGENEEDTDGGSATSGEDIAEAEAYGGSTPDAEAEADDGVQPMQSVAEAEAYGGSTPDANAEADDGVQTTPGAALANALEDNSLAVDYATVLGPNGENLTFNVNEQPPYLMMYQSYKNKWSWYFYKYVAFRVKKYRGNVVGALHCRALTDAGRFKTAVFRYNNMDEVRRGFVRLPTNDEVAFYTALPRVRDSLMPLPPFPAPASF